MLRILIEFSMRGLLSKKDAQTLTGKSSSSTRWLQRKAADVYTRRAHEEGFVARSAFKLQQILYANRRIRARTVVDLGASPGGWTQVALRRFRGSRVVSVDLKPLVAQERGCTSLILDFLSPGAESVVKQALGDQKADLVMSDMAPSYSGQRSVDHMRLMELSNKALNFAKKVLRPGGSFICKASTGGEEPLFKNRLQKLFEQIKRAPEEEEAAEQEDAAATGASLPPLDDFSALEAAKTQEMTTETPNDALSPSSMPSQMAAATATSAASGVSKPEQPTKPTAKTIKPPQKPKSSVRPSGIKSKKRKRAED